MSEALFDILFLQSGRPGNTADISFALMRTREFSVQLKCTKCLFFFAPRQLRFAETCYFVIFFFLSPRQNAGAVRCYDLKNEIDFRSLSPWSMLEIKHTKQRTETEENNLKSERKREPILSKCLRSFFFIFSSNRRVGNWALTAGNRYSCLFFSISSAFSQAFESVFGVHSSCNLKYIRCDIFIQSRGGEISLRNMIGSKSLSSKIAKNDRPQEGRV